MSTTTYALETKWVDEDGKNFTQTFKHHKGTSTDAEVKAFAQGYITNGDFLKRVPTACTAATKIETVRTDYDLS